MSRCQDGRNEAFSDHEPPIVWVAMPEPLAARAERPVVVPRSDALRPRLDDLRWSAAFQSLDGANLFVVRGAILLDSRGAARLSSRPTAAALYRGDDEEWRWQYQWSLDRHRAALGLPAWVLRSVARDADGWPEVLGRVPQTPAAGRGVDELDKIRAERDAQERLANEALAILQRFVEDSGEAANDGSE